MRIQISKQCIYSDGMVFFSETNRKLENMVEELNMKEV